MTGKVTFRQSNMELLRIISMIIIMVIHAQFYKIPYSVPRWFIVIGADSGVNCFVLISGYFGIRPKVKSFTSFIFQILFFIALGNVVIAFNGRGNYLSFNPLYLNWFIQSYIALYVFAPLLNAFAENSTERQFRCFLIIWAVVEFVMAYMVDFLKFERGYSFQAFILLYMIARYISIHGGKFFSFNKRFDILLFFAFTLLSAVLMFFSEAIGKSNGGEYYLRAYNSPLMILSSVYFMLFFSKIELKSKVVNWVGRSAYAAFLLHCVFINWYRTTCLDFYLENHWIVASLYSVLFIVLLFLVALLVDQVRIKIWERATYFISPFYNEIKNRIK